jgi:hypothetical protein
MLCVNVKNIFLGFGPLLFQKKKKHILNKISEFGKTNANKLSLHSL